MAIPTTKSTESKVKEGAANWRWCSVVTSLILIVITAAAVVSRLWVLTAIPIGVLFGFFLQKGDLCGSSAFSEVLMFRDRRKLVGLWMVIVVGMLGIAALDLLGLVSLNPKPFLYLGFVIGGIIFGVGMVLAGGCVSGCLYKSATGNLNSIVAVLGIPVGVMLVEYGPLHTTHQWIRGWRVDLAGGSMSIDRLLGIPFWSVAVTLALLTFVFFWVSRQKHKPEVSHAPFSLERILTRPWRPWVAGLAIGLLMAPAYLSSAVSGRNYPLGVTHGVMQAALLVVDQDFTHVYRIPLTPPVAAASEATATAGTQSPIPAPKKKIVWWLVTLVGSIVAGSWVSAHMSGKVRLLPKPPEQLVFAAIGGVLVGLGAAIAGGCVVGNIMSGWAMLSLGCILFGVVVVAANWATTYVYLMGGHRR